MKTELNSALRVPDARYASHPRRGCSRSGRAAGARPLPELHRLDHHPESAPEARQRHFAIGKLLLELEELGLQHAPGRDAGRLFGDPGSDLAILGTTVEILHYLEGAHLLHPAGHMHLTVERMPGEEQTDAGIAFQLLRLATPHVGVKDHPLGIVVLEQHSALPGLTIGIDGRHHHGGGIGQFGLTGLRQPLLEKRQRLGRQIGPVQPATGVFTAQISNIHHLDFPSNK